MVLWMVAAAMAFDASCFTGDGLKVARGRDSDLDVDGRYTNSCGEVIIGVLGRVDLRSRGGVKSEAITVIVNDMNFDKGTHGWGPQLELPRLDTTKAWLESDRPPQAQFGWLLVVSAASISVAWTSLEVYLADGTVLVRP
ncbi:hypothetical protein LBMAG42_23380 [Deltaproteobacteria bacterium]|nr:hypothetical protein LBMAG42_23380 [Deltaproteobacteria bacterium]